MTRSSAEAEIRDVVVERLRRLRPSARIIHEVNVSGQGSNRIDVLAVDIDEIIAVEIKSERDTMSRAEAQVRAMRDITHHVIVALHECHLIEQETNEHAAQYGRLNGKHYLRIAPPETKGAMTWVYPERTRHHAGFDYDVGMWLQPARRMEQSLPSTALHLLWRDELATLCDRLRISRGRRSTMTDMTRAIWWYATGREITKGICAALRMRQFAEADAPIYDRAIEMAEADGK